MILFIWEKDLGIIVYNYRVNILIFPTIMHVSLCKLQFLSDGRLGCPFLYTQLKKFEFEFL
jgi:hypothetical protein